MRKFLFSAAAIVMLLTAIAILGHPSPAKAAFNPNNLMDDAIFDNYNTMTASQIDAWLNTNFPNSCISTNHGFTAADPNGYSPTTGFTYGANVSAGQVLFDASQAYGVNPQVLIVTLQKEESLVTGDGGCSVLRYTAAAGYGCPDGGTTYDYTGLNLYAINGTTVTSVSGTCVNGAAKAGFSQQVIRAAWLLKFGEQRSEGNTAWAVIKGSWNNSDDPATCYGGPMTQGYRKRCSSDSAAVYYDGFTTIDSSSTHMDTGATAAFYWYTPHFPGNRNFVNIFTNWFGNTTLGCQPGEGPMPQVVSMYNPRTYDHFYTAYACEANILGYQLDYVYEGAVFNTTPSSAVGAVPVWRLYNPGLGLHFWTVYQDDINNASRLGYNLEGIAFYTVSPSAPNVFAAVQRLYNPRTYQHLWSMSQNTINIATQQAGYTLEGVAFYSQQ